jgi:hypothetical protein
MFKKKKINDFSLGKKNTHTQTHTNTYFKKLLHNIKIKISSLQKALKNQMKIPKFKK